MKSDKLQELHNKLAYKNLAKNPDEITSYYEWVIFEWCLKNSQLDIKRASFFEIASGSGNFFHFLDRNGVNDYLGCEIGEQPIAQFTKFFPNKAHLLIKGDALSVLKSHKSKSFDCIIAWNVLEHLADDYLGELLDLISHKLNPKGELWILVPCSESIISQYNRYSDLTHKRLFSVRDFRILTDMYNMKILARTGRIVPVRSLKDVIRYLHNQFLYWLNRFLFMFDIGIHANLGVFSQELTIILKKRD